MGLAERIASKFLVTTDDVIGFASRAPRHYKEFKIPKANGGERHIAQPSARIKDIQRFLVQEELYTLPVHTASQAYGNGCSIRKNAECHSQNSHLLKMDFTDFFNSIEPKHFRAHVRDHLPKYYTRQEMAILWRYLFWAQPTLEKPRRYRLCLSIGAPSSPFISNTLMYTADSLISEVTKKFEVTYSRYADDLTFSATSFEQLRPIKKFVLDMHLKQDFSFLKVNRRKTTFSSKANHRRITGLVISNEGEVSLGRERKRLISAMIHKFKLRKMHDVSDRAKLRGLLAFAKDAEPEFINRLEQKYGRKVLYRIRKV